MATQEQNDFLLALGMPADLVAKLNASVAGIVAPKDPSGGADATSSESAGAPPGAAPRGTAGSPKLKPHSKNAPHKDPSPEPFTLTMKGTPKRVPMDPDDPFSPEVEIFDPDPGSFPDSLYQEPMPKVRPHKDLVIKYLQDIPEFASGRAVSYCQSVADACDGFEKYTKKRIKAITAPSFGAELVFGSLVAVISTVAAGPIGAEGLKGLTKLLAEGVKGAIEDSVKKVGEAGYKKATGNESKAEELENMAEALATKAKSEAGRVKQVVVDNINQVTNPLIVKLTGGGELLKEEDEFILPFAAADSAGKN